MIPVNIVWRTTPVETDPSTVRDILISSGFFYPEEINMAVDMVNQSIPLDNTSTDYRFLFMEHDGWTAGYTCYGHIDGTQASYDLYWIAVHNNVRGHGFGTRLLKKMEQLILNAGGQRIYIETSSRDQYKPTQDFYEKMQYNLEAILKDFYAVGDDKLIYVKGFGPRVTTTGQGRQ
jgi:ribosomal protein S18 acetylase RimI-like enzyme